MTTPQPEVLPVATLEYAHGPDTAWRPVIHAMLFAIILMCVATVVRSMGFVGFGYWRTGQFSTAIEMSPLMSISLIVLGWCMVGFVCASAVACLRFRRGADRMLVVALIVGNVFGIAGRAIAAVYLAVDDRYELADVVYYVSYSFTDFLDTLVPSAAVICIFTRPIVREMFR